MSDVNAPEHVPTEEDILTADGGGFSMEQWKFALAAGKYDDHEVEMARLLSRRAVARNTRRWEITWRGQTVSEDEYTLRACSHAQKYSGLVWGAMAGQVRIDPEWDTDVTLALLYGMARTTLGMNEAEARSALDELTGPEVREILSYRDGDERPKDDSDQ